MASAHHVGTSGAVATGSAARAPPRHRSTAEEGRDGLEGGARTARGPGRPGRPRGRPGAAAAAPSGRPARRRDDPARSPPVEEHRRARAADQCPVHTSGSVRPAPAEDRRATAPEPRVPSRPPAPRHSLAVMTARRIAIVPHTHWDREWYKSYQDFRLALVELIDTLIPLLERDASYPHFMLDGQMAVVDDYLEVRPEAEDRLRALAAAGRVSMGPWYILMDEFLASGETIVRNLQMGIERGAAFGGVMDVGYLPDMFGHIAQMPQILRLGGLPRRRGVARRAVAGDQERLRVGGTRRLVGAGRVPARRLRQRRRPARRRQGAGPPHRATTSPRSPTSSSTTCCA